MLSRDTGLNEDTLVTTIPLNYYTTSQMLQEVMEKPLEKKVCPSSIFTPPLLYNTIAISPSGSSLEIFARPAAFICDYAIPAD